MQRLPQHSPFQASIFHFPSQMLLGCLFIVFGVLLLLKKIGKDYLPFLPEDILVYGCIAGTIIGGLHMIWAKIWRPRIYLR